ncbi:MAG: peptidoglycan DD-metalloendopeptidase family protein [Thermomicrobiales bacterium]|nr:peptidoglycan DD-metalloendopeptidase family protein [Thermomicrobiales bacterium]
MTDADQTTPFPALLEHGPQELDGAPVARRTIVSAVWGNTPIRVTTENAMDVTPWNPDCSWYQYGLQLCLNGCQHPGMDIGLQRGTALFAAEGGIVDFAGWSRAYRPHYVAIKADSGGLHIYGHMWKVDPAVVTGGRVQAGQYLGNSGEQTVVGTMTPDGSGPHLHFEVRKNGCSVNPEPILVNASAVGPLSVAFNPGDCLRVTDGPLQLRNAAGLSAAVLGALDAGTRAIVVSGPDNKDGHAWYDIQVIGRKGRGWVAGTFCEVIQI